MIRWSLPIFILLGMLIVIPASGAPSDQHLIVPGVRIGPAKLGMSIVELTDILGTPKSTNAYQDRTVRYRWYEYVPISNGSARALPVGGGGLSVVANPQGVVFDVTAYFSPEYTTAEGLHTGVREEQVVAALGHPFRIDRYEGTHALLYRGLVFWLGDNPQNTGYHVVFQISVM